MVFFFFLNVLMLIVPCEMGFFWIYKCWLFHEDCDFSFFSFLFFIFYFYLFLFFMLVVFYERIVISGFFFFFPRKMFGVVFLVVIVALKCLGNAQCTQNE